MLKFKSFIKQVFIYLRKYISKDGKYSISDPAFFSSAVEKIYYSSAKYYSRKGLVYFPEINSFGAFDYNIVKDILTNNEDISVSSIHLALNSIYFSKDEDKHQHNKKAAINNLDFLSKKLQYTDSEYTRNLFKYFSEKFPVNQSFDLVDYLINPIILINVLNEFGFLEVFTELNPFSKDFSYTNAIDKIKLFFSDTDTLELMIKNHLDNGGIIPSKMQELLNELYSDVEVSTHLPKYFRSMIFSAVESTTSFLSSMVYVIHTRYPQLLKEKNTHEKLYSIANEVLRIYTPVPFIYRSVKKNTMYNGFFLKEGDLVILFLGAANMDPSIFENPNKIIEGRKEKHLSFGRGQYACIGQYASFRITMNVLSYLAESAKKIELIDKEAKHIIHNSMLKISLKVIINDSKN